VKRQPTLIRFAAFIVAASLVAACGGSGSSGPITPTVTPCPAGYTGTAPSCTLAQSGSTSAALSTTAATTINLPPVGGYGGTTVFPASSGAATLTLADQTAAAGSPPGGNPVLQGALRRAAQSWGKVMPESSSTNIPINTPMLYLTITANATVSFTTSPTLTFTLPSASTGPFYVAAFMGGAWQTIAGPGTISGTTVTFTTGSGSFTLTSGVPVYLAFYTGGVLAAPTPTPTPTANPQAYTCPSSDGTTAVARDSAQSVAAESISRLGVRSGAPAAKYAPGLLAVSYSDGALQSGRSAILAREQSLGASEVRELHFNRLGTATRILGVDPSKLDSIASSLRGQIGVRSVDRVALRYPAVVSHPYITNDPYFVGFTGSVAPYYEAATLPGQWNMHAIRLDYAFAYSQAADVPNGVTANPNALGSSSVKLAVIDTGMDTLHPELASKIVYQKCFITNPSNVQSTSNFVTDPDGHGTDVSGIADAASNNSIGFVGAGGNVSLMAYRVFPFEDSTCDNPASGDGTCSATTADIASAIDDAVAQGAKVISISLGGGNCSSGGVDQDPTEGEAIANAIASNVIVVAASGNSGGALLAPSCDSGVLAVGASALGDGRQNGTNSDGSVSSPVEYVASYSDFGSPGAAIHSSSAWGIVAPGGDPGANDLNANLPTDDLHWIEDIWTSTPFDSNDTGTCSEDYQAINGTIDCRTLIAGTSMATPHVAGAAALILSVNLSYGTPAKMKALLCSTATEINDAEEGCGRLDVYRAMATAMGDPNLP
jgi:hypothetical protein